MELKIIEGVKVKAGDTLVVIPSTHLSMEQSGRLMWQSQKLGLDLLLLPPGSQVYIKTSERQQPTKRTLAQMFSALRR